MRGGTGWWIGNVVGSFVLQLQVSGCRPQCLQWLFTDTTFQHQDEVNAKCASGAGEKIDDKQSWKLPYDILFSELFSAVAHLISFVASTLEIGCYHYYRLRRAANTRPESIITLTLRCCVKEKYF